jgi:predicted permease
MLARYADRRDIDFGGGPVRANVELITGSYFPVLGVPALHGRTIGPGDDNRGHPAPVAVISYGLWNRQYAGDPSAIGKTIHIQRAAFTIIGVAPPEFFGVEVGSAADVWAPLSTLGSVYPGRNWLDDRNTNFLDFLGRLRPGIPAAQASAALTPTLIEIQFQRVGDIPEWIRAEIRKSKVELIPAAKGISSLRYWRRPLHIVFGIVALVLLLASVNLMNLQAARVSERRKELAVRLAIGASRLRVARQVFTESVLLALAGGSLGLLVCRPTADLLLALVSSGNPVFLHLSFNSQLLAFIAAISIGAAILCGVAPAWRATRGEVLPAIQQGSGAAKASRAGRLFGRGLASLQVALSLVLVAGAILFATSLYKLTHIDTGLDRSRLLVLDVDPVDAGYQRDQVSALSRRLAARLAALPGVQSATSSSNGVYSGRNSNCGVQPEGYRSGNPQDLFAWYDQAGPRYFSTIGARLIAGRDFDKRDDSAAPKVMIVSQEFVRFYFAGRNPIGRTVAIEEEWKKPKILRQVVGVVKDMRGGSDVRQKPQRYFYLPTFQTKAWASTRFLVRAAGDPKPLFSAVRAAVRAEDPGRLQYRHRGGSAESHARDQPADRGLLGRVWNPGAAAGRHRNLRPAFLRSRATQWRSGHSHGAGRTARADRAHGAVRGRVAGGDRRGCRRSRRAGHGQAGARPGIRTGARQSRGADGRRARADGRRSMRRAVACPPRGPARSDGGFAERITRNQQLIQMQDQLQRAFRLRHARRGHDPCRPWQLRSRVAQATRVERANLEAKEHCILWQARFPSRHPDVRRIVPRYIRRVSTGHHRDD